MTPEKLRIALAEACPAVIRQSPRVGEWQWFDGQHWHRCHNNDPLQDLNAMHEAEKLLWSKDWTLRDVFVDKLARILDPALGYYKQDGVDLLDATAAQRAEAFLKTLNLWTE